MPCGYTGENASEESARPVLRGIFARQSATRQWGIGDERDPQLAAGIQHSINFWFTVQK